MNRLFLVTAAAALPVLSPAQEPPALEPVVVVGTRSEQERNRLPAAVTVITRDQIERSGARHVAEVLRMAGALLVSDLYGDGSRVNLDLRGFGDTAHSGTLVLVDGRRLNNADLAPPDLGTIAVNDIERIEIIQGSATTLYGDQAVGGVVNIVTRHARGFAAEAGAEAGSDDALGARAALAQAAGAASVRLSAQSRATDNYRDHNALEAHHVLARLGYGFGSASAFVEAGYVDEDLQTPGPLFAAELARDRRQSTPAFRRDFSATRTHFTRLNWRQPFGDWTLDADLMRRVSDGEFRLSFASGFSSPGTQDRELWSLHPRASAELPTTWGDALLTLGLDGQLTDYRLDSAAFGLQSNDHRETGAYAQAIVPLPANLELTLGGRAARVDNTLQDAFAFPTPTRLRDDESSGEAGLALRPHAAMRAFARYERVFRFAKVDELTNACAPAPGAVNLDTQRGHSWEAGVELGDAGARLRATGYRLELRDEIAFDGTACFGFGANVNLERTRRDGLIVEGSWALAQALWLDGAWHHLDSEVRGGGISGRDIPLVPRDAGRLALAGRLPAGFSARLEAQAVGKRRFAGDFDNTLGHLPRFSVANAVLGWSPGALRVEARVNNVFDREYTEYGAAGFDAGFTERESFFPSPERNVRVALGYRW
jgi:iron complex outermembrane recepter protein